MAQVFQGNAMHQRHGGIVLEQFPTGKALVHFLSPPNPTHAVGRGIGVFCLWALAWRTPPMLPAHAISPDGLRQAAIRRSTAVRNCLICSSTLAGSTPQRRSDSVVRLMLCSRVFGAMRSAIFAIKRPRRVSGK